MRISDWSSDVCSSDLVDMCGRFLGREPLLVRRRRGADAEQELRLGGGEPVGKHRHGNGGIGLRNDVAHEDRPRQPVGAVDRWIDLADLRSEEHTSELQSLMRISYAVFCLKKNIQHHLVTTHL